MITHVDMHTHKKNFLKLAKRSTCKRREGALFESRQTLVTLCEDLGGRHRVLSFCAGQHHALVRFHASRDLQTASGQR